MNKQIIDDLIYYNPNTGSFTFLYRDRKYFKNEGIYRHWNERFANKKAGTIKSSGYVFITIFNKTYRAHRLAWLHMTGEFPPLQIDHVNGDRSDNRWLNLRSVTNSENSKNQKRKSTNKSGVTGVWFSSQKRKWVAELIVDYKKIHLGTFSDINDAKAARKEAEKTYGFHANHGRG